MSNILPIDTATEPNIAIVNQADSPIEVDGDNTFDDDSALGDSLSDTNSITSSIVAYVYENGRRYHAYKAGSYLLPNDDREQERLDLGHHLSLLMHDGLLFECNIIDKPKRILDVGCGTGIWAIAMADEYPEAEVIGIDLSPIQPSWVPPNCQFQVDDCESEWTFPPDQLFDMIRISQLGGSISDWPRLISQAYRQLAPGGSIELFDTQFHFFCDDGTFRPDSCIATFTSALHEASTLMGKPIGVGSKHAGWLQDAGFEDIHDLIYRLPISPWPKDRKLKEYGRWMALLVMDGVDSYGLALLHRVLGWEVERIHVLLAGFREELKKGDMHLYHKAHDVYGRKPLN